MTTAIILWGLVFSSIGVGYCIYGRRQDKKLVFYSGLGLLVFPYFLQDVLSLVLIGIGLIALPFFASRFLD